MVASAAPRMVAAREAAARAAARAAPRALQAHELVRKNVGAERGLGVRGCELREARPD